MQSGFVTVGPQPSTSLDEPPSEKRCKANEVLDMLLVLAGTDLTFKTM